MIALLFICLAVPASTALLLMLFRTSVNQANARWVACCGSIVALAFSVFLLIQYRASAIHPLETNSAPAVSSAEASSAIQPRAEFRRPWLSSGSMQLEMYFGVDGISVTMIALTALLT